MVNTTQLYDIELVGMYEIKKRYTSLKKELKVMTERAMRSERELRKTEKRLERANELLSKLRRT